MSIQTMNTAPGRVTSMAAGKPVKVPMPPAKKPGKAPSYPGYPKVGKSAGTGISAGIGAGQFGLGTGMVKGGHV